MMGFLSSHAENLIAVLIVDVHQTARCLPSKSSKKPGRRGDSTRLQAWCALSLSVSVFQQVSQL
jgi:hypothetical protein